MRGPCGRKRCLTSFCSPAAGGLVGALLWTGAAAAVQEVSFDRTPDGVYTDARVRADWKGLKWSGLADRARIVSGREALSGKCLEVKYPKGAVGPGEGGGQFMVRLPPRDEYWCDYHVKFGQGFDFVKGGKLPGLTGGRSNTGGNRPTGDGWSARYMWRRDGEIVIYLYHMDQRTKYGDSLALGRRFASGRWYRLTQRIRVNTPEKKNGVIQVWVDGEEALHRTDIRFRNVEGALRQAHDAPVLSPSKGEGARVDHFYFSTFHGGSGRDWAPGRDCYVYFDSFRIHPTGERLFPSFLAKDVTKLRDVAAHLRQDELGPALAAAERHLDSADAEKATEARRVVEVLEGHLERRHEEIRRMKEHDPVAAVEQLSKLARQFSPTEKSKELAAEAAAWKKEPVVRDELRARPVLARMQKMADAVRRKLDGKPATDPVMQRRYGREIVALRNGIAALSKRYPETASAKRALGIAAELGIPIPE